LPLSPYIFILRTVATQFFYLGIGLLTALAILFFLSRLSVLGVIMSLPGLVIILFFSYSIVSVTSYLGLRYRDLPHALTGLLNLLFVLTPVLYPAEVLAKKGIYVAAYANPLASMIEIVRKPLLQASLSDPYHYVFSIAFTVSLFMLSLYLRNRWEKLIPFWSRLSFLTCALTIHLTPQTEIASRQI
jgi:lipopolysaccharide transport system permease protein